MGPTNSLEARFSEKKIAGLTMAMVAIDGRTRVAVSFRALVASYQPMSVASNQTRPHGGHNAFEGKTAMASLTFGLRPVPPFRLDLTAWALRRRARNIVDRWEDATYSRVVVIEEMPVEVMVRQTASREQPNLAVTMPTVRESCWQAMAFTSASKGPGKRGGLSPRNRSASGASRRSAAASVASIVATATCHKGRSNRHS